MAKEWSFLMNSFKSEHNSAFVTFAPILRYTVSKLNLVKGDDPKYMAMYTLLKADEDAYEEFFKKLI